MFREQCDGIVYVRHCTARGGAVFCTVDRLDAVESDAVNVIPVSSFSLSHSQSELPRRQHVRLVSRVRAVPSTRTAREQLELS